MSINKLQTSLMLSFTFEIFNEISSPILSFFLVPQLTSCSTEFSSLSYTSWLASCGVQNPATGNVMFTLARTFTPFIALFVTNLLPGPTFNLSVRSQVLYQLCYYCLPLEQIINFSFFFKLYPCWMLTLRFIIFFSLNLDHFQSYFDVLLKKQ